jgi:hypothetical protein
MWYDMNFTNFVVVHLEVEPHTVCSPECEISVRPQRAVCRLAAVNVTWKWSFAQELCTLVNIYTGATSRRPTSYCGQGQLCETSDSSIVCLMPSLFLNVAKRRFVVGYRRFGTAYRSYLWGVMQTNGNCLTIEDGTDRLSRNVGHQLLTSVT